MNYSVILGRLRDLSYRSSMDFQADQRIHFTFALQLWCCSVNSHRYPAILLCRKLSFNNYWCLYFELMISANRCILNVLTMIPDASWHLCTMLQTGTAHALRVFWGCWLGCSIFHKFRLVSFERNKLLVYSIALFTLDSFFKLSVL